MVDEMKRKDTRRLCETNRSLKNILESKHKFDNKRSCSLNKNFSDVNKEVSEGTPKGGKKYGRSRKMSQEIWRFSAKNQQARKGNDNNIECGGVENITICPHIPSERKNAKDAVNIRTDKENNE